MKAVTKLEPKQTVAPKNLEGELQGRRNRHHYYEAIAYCLVNPKAMWQNYFLQIQYRDDPSLIWC
jgi:hypothetical protein